MTERAEAIPAHGRVRVEPDDRRGAVIGVVPGTEGTEIAVLLDDGTTVAVVATALARPPHLAADPAAFTTSTAARSRPAARPRGQEADESDLSEYLDALSGMPAYRQQVDQDELRLIDAAKTAGATWQQIGLALGSDADGAKQRAHRRRQALADPRRSGAQPPPHTAPAGPDNTADLTRSPIDRPAEAIGAVEPGTAIG